jgi:hypothetical protein
MQDTARFMQHFSSQLALRYHRPELSIALDFQPASCLVHGGTAEPAYMMTISTLPSLLQPATNKRNTAILQRYLEETLCIPPARGCVRYIPLGEDNFAYGGTTAAGHMVKVERSTSTHNPGDMGRADSRAKRMSRRLSVKVRPSSRPSPRPPFRENANSLYLFPPSPWRH